MIIRRKAYPRVGLIGNPSDGYNGKTIAFAFSNFRAQVVLYETPTLEILPNERDHSRFASIRALAQDVNAYGYYGGIRLLKATVKRFFDYCQEKGIDLHTRNFTTQYESDIPHLVGLAGSSAIITACMRCLMTFYGVTIPKPELPNLILSVEKDELGISAGLQDRVAQVYQGLVYMDFARELMEKQGHGNYRNLDVGALPPLYVAYRVDLSEGSDVFHNNIRYRFEKGDSEVVGAMRHWAALADRMEACLNERRGADVAALTNENFDLRAKLYRLSQGNLRMVEIARSVGASAKFTGSGGAIVGTYEGEETYAALAEKMTAVGIRVLKPAVVATDDVGE